MARHPRIESCMFCSDFPCSCPKAAPAKKAAKKKATDSPAPVPVYVEPPAPVDIAAAMRAEVRTVEQAVTDDRALTLEKNRWVSREDFDADYRATQEEFNNAVRILEPILSPEERARHRSILTREPSERAQRWRARNGRSA